MQSKNVLSTEGRSAKETYESINIAKISLANLRHTVVNFSQRSPGGKPRQTRQSSHLQRRLYDHGLAASGAAARRQPGRLIAGDGLSVDQAGAYLERVHRFGNERIAGRPVVAVAGQQPNADRVSPGHQPTAVVLDLVDPIGTRGRSVGGGRKAGFYKARRMGTHEHTGVIAATTSACESDCGGCATLSRD